MIQNNSIIDQEGKKYKVTLTEIEEVDPNKESKEWFENGGKVEYYSIFFDTWEIKSNPIWTDSDDFRPYTHGLKVGDVIDKDVLNAWGKLGNESLYKRNLSVLTKLWNRNPRITSFYMHNGLCMFSSGDVTSYKAEGYKEFAENFKKEKEYPINTWLIAS
jgi:hypothetical protein